MRCTFLASLALLSLTANAGTTSRLYSFEADTPAQASQINEELDNILSTINGNVDSANLSQNAVATGNIASASVTQSKLGPKGEQISSAPPFAQRSSAVEALIPNLTGNITVISRPVWVGLQASANTSAPGRVMYRHNGGGATDNSAYVTFQRDQATRNMVAIGARSITSSADDILQQLPCSAFSFIDQPTPGPHNYSAAFRIATSDNGIITVENCQLVLFEL